MLQLKLIATLNADGTQLTVQDVTGNYNAVTNPTGYGAPNRSVSPNIILRWKLYNSPVWIVLPGVTSDQLQTGYVIDTQQLGITDVPQLIQDGVNFAQYLGLYSKGNTVTVDGTCKVTLTNFQVSDFNGIYYIAFGSDLTQVYQIVSRGTGYLILDRPYSGALTSETAYDAQNGDAYYLVQTYCNSQLDNEVAGIPAEFFDGTQLNTAFYKMMKLFIAQARFGKTDYYGSDLIMQNLYTQYFTGRFHGQC